MGITATAKTSAVSFSGFHPTKTHPDSGDYYADLVNFIFNLFVYCSTFGL